MYNFINQEQSQWDSNLKLTSKFGQYHGTTSVDLILTPGWCQISNIWTSTHAVNMMSRMCLENDHWQMNLVNKWWLKKYFGWKKMVWSICYQQLTSLLCRQLTSEKVSFLTYGWWSIDVNYWHHLVSILHFCPLGIQVEKWVHYV